MYVCAFSLFFFFNIIIIPSLWDKNFLPHLTDEEVEGSVSFYIFFNGTEERQLRRILKEHVKHNFKNSWNGFKNGQGFSTAYIRHCNSKRGGKQQELNAGYSSLFPENMNLGRSGLHTEEGS